MVLSFEQVQRTQSFRLGVRLGNDDIAVSEFPVHDLCIVIGYFSVVAEKPTHNLWMNLADQKWAILASYTEQGKIPTELLEDLRSTRLLALESIVQPTINVEQEIDLQIGVVFKRVNPKKRHGSPVMVHRSQSVPSIPGGVAYSLA